MASKQNEWKGKKVLVTGGASGIGKGVATSFANLGATVIIADINENALQEIKHELSKAGAEFSETINSNTIHTIKLDITDEEQIKNTIDHIIREHEELHVIVNSAGLQHVAMIEDFPADIFEKLWRIMCFGPFLTIKYAMPYMKKQQYGRIINIASINGLIGFAGKSAYNSAKHGVIGLTKVAALEGAKEGITVNALCPGYVNTKLVQNQLGDLAKTRGVSLDQVLEDVLYPLIPQKRLLTIDEVASYTVFLASEQARGITGQAVVIDGGYTAQ